MLADGLNLSELAHRFQAAQPFPHICVDGLLKPDAARALAAAYPPFEEALAVGRSFSAINEHRKVEVTDPACFPGPLQGLTELLASQAFRDQLAVLTGIPNLLFDDAFSGGGMHQTASSGWLDVHVDFNVLLERGLHRRLNLLLYLNEEWRDDWGGQVELWDPGVKQCHLRVGPQLNRCLIFATSRTSYHGVTPVSCPEGRARKSFAVYYYTKEAPPEYDGRFHDTIFRARPEEHTKHWKMPAVQFKRVVGESYINAAHRIKKLLR